MSDWGMTIIASRKSAERRQGVFIYDRWGLYPQINLEHFLEGYRSKLISMGERDRVKALLERRAAFTHDHVGFVSEYWITPQDDADPLPEYVLAIRLDDLDYRQWGMMTPMPPRLTELTAAWRWLFSGAPGDE